MGDQATNLSPAGQQSILVDEGQSGQRSNGTTAYPAAVDQYKAVLEDAQSLGNRRDTINSLFVGTVSLVAGGEGYILIALAGTGTGLLVMLAATIFGVGLCRIWADALGSYQALLKFRYETLKVWEEKYDFPSLLKFYTSEEMLYGERGKPPIQPTELTDSVAASLLGSARFFSDMYVDLPKLARRILIALVALQMIALLGRIFLPILPVIVPTHLLSPFGL